MLVLTSAGVLAGTMLVAWLPAASAQQCVVSVTLVGGQKLSFTVDVPPGTTAPTPALPAGALVASVSQSCASAASGTTTTTSTTTTTTAGTTTTTTTTGSGSKPPQSAGAPHPQTPSVNKHAKPVKAPSSTTKSKGSSSKKGRPPASVTTKPSTPLRTGTGVPTPSNPTFSFSLPGAAPIGVPNFFIDSFRIPPFLLPIYQAAGIQYDVPWQVLAGINEIETDYGRNLSISSAGAVGWMQFLPATWKQYGVDANGDGVADPYNPVDAIFAAARYLHAAGASKNLSNAILAYNHAGWYVQSVLLRAKLIGGMPDQLIGALTGLVGGHFPVAAPAKYADDHIEKLATRRVTGANAAIPVNSDPNSKGVSIFAKKGSPVIAVNDGKILKIGSSAKLGKFVQLQDATGNIYTYAQLGSVPATYPVPKPVKVTASQIAQELSKTPAPKPSAPASAGQQLGTPGSQPALTAAGLQAAKTVKTGHTAKPLATVPQALLPSAPVATPLVKERLFANPSRPASYAAGGARQLQTQSTQISSFENYFSDVLNLGNSQYSLQPLKSGSIVVAGTIIGRIAAPSGTTASHVVFMIQPAGKGAPQIDPKPILDGWKLLEATAVYRAAGKDPFFGPGAKNPTVGQVLLMSKSQLTQRILADPHIKIYACGRRDIAAGLIDRRVLATLEFLVGSGLDPTVSSLQCGNTLLGSSSTSAAGATGSSVEISDINGIPIVGHQGAGSITDITIRRLLTLQGAMKPNQIISQMSYKGQPNTLALPDHQNRIQVDYTPLFGQNTKLSTQLASILKPDQWVKLINRIGQIPEPVVPIAPSQYAIKAGG